jgi:hypothetical protein
MGTVPLREREAMRAMSRPIVGGSMAESLEKVGFMIAGTQRGGTTTLHEYLRRHPEICMPAKKELHFFDNEKLWRAQLPSYAAYRAAFPVEPSHRLLGDATPIYMYWEPAVPRIRDYNPAMKLILVLRNPITRAYSHWNHERLAGRESLSFRDALLAEPSRAEQARPLQLRNGSYVQRGMYTRQLARVWANFPTQQTLVLKTDDLRTALASVFARIASFLGIARFTPAHAITANAWTYDAPMSPADRRYLVGVFEQEIMDLERLLGWDCSEWLAEERGVNRRRSGID